jgi:hypothetical protein
VLAFAYGTDFQTLTSITPTAQNPWIEDGRQVTFDTSGGTQFLTGPLIQFGGAPSPSAETFVQWTYVAGYVNTVTSGTNTAGDADLDVVDPAGIQPNDVLRVWDDTAVASEAVTVASTYVPATPTWPPTPTAVPLAGTLAFSHAAGVGVSDMPRIMLQAVVMYAVSLLLRQDASSAQPFAGSAFSPSVRRDVSRGAAGGLLSEAETILERFKPTRWGN